MKPIPIFERLYPAATNRCVPRIITVERIERRDLPDAHLNTLEPETKEKQNG